jgi:hypothetical protein
MTQLKPLLTEAAVDLLIDQLKSNFNTLLTEIDNQYDDGINLEPLGDESIHLSDRIEGLRLPSCHILFGHHAFNYTKDPNYLESADGVVVVLSAEDSGDEILTRKMWRYGRVLHACFNLMSLGDSRIQIQTIPKQLGYTATIASKMSKEKSRFRKDAVLELELMHFEKNLI